MGKSCPKSESPDFRAGVRQGPDGRGGIKESRGATTALICRMDPGPGRGRVTAPTPSSRRRSALSSSALDRRRSGLFLADGGGGHKDGRSWLPGPGNERDRAQRGVAAGVGAPTPAALSYLNPSGHTSVGRICFFLHISTRVVNLKSFWGLSFLPSSHLTGQDSRLAPAFRERLNTFHRS